MLQDNTTQIVNHASRHENGGADEISVLGLSGLLADAQIPLAHTQLEVTITDLDKYTQSEVDILLAGKAALVHIHDDRYYTETETDALLANKSNTGHTHVEANITDLDKYTQAEVDALVANSSNWDTAYGWGDHAGLYELLGAVNTHAGLTTGIHGVGGSTIASVLDITNHTGLPSAHHTAFTQTDADLLYEALGDLAIHAALSTGVHGAGANTLATDNDIANHAGLPNVHHTAFVKADADSLYSVLAHTHTHASTTGKTANDHHVAFVQGDADLLYDPLGSGAGAVTTHETTYNHAHYDTAYGWGDHAGLYSLLAHLHDTQTIEPDGIDSDGGAFAFSTTGVVTFNQNLIVQNSGNIGPVGQSDLLELASNSAIVNGTSYLHIIGKVISDTADHRAMFMGYRARTGPAAVESGDYLVSFIGRGYDGSDYETAQMVEMKTTQNWTPTAHGSSIALYTTPDDSVTSTERVTICCDGNVGFGNDTPVSKVEINNATFSGQYGSFADERASLLVSGKNPYHSIQVSSTYNSATYPNYGLVLVNGTDTTDFDIWGIMHDGPARAAGGLCFAYLNGTGTGENIHTVAPMVTFKKTGDVAMTGALAVTGNITGPNVTSGADPGHTHSIYSPIAHLHNTQTLQHDGVNSDGGAFPFTTTGDVTFNKGVNIGEGMVIQSDKIVVCDTYTSTGINAAIDALGAEGGTVFLPEGTYAIDSVITIDQNNTSLIGGGWGTILDASAWSTDHVIDLNGVSNCRIANLQIEGQDGGGNTKALIADSGSAASYCIFENLYLHHSDYAGIWLSGVASTNNTIRGCTISDCDNMGLYLDGGAYNHIEGNTFGPSNNRGVFTGSVCYYTEWTNNVAHTNTLEGFYFGSTHQTIVGNEAHNNHDGFHTGTTSTITGNCAHINAGTGFNLAGSSCSISGNTAYRNGNAHQDYWIAGSKNSFVGNQGDSAAGRSDWGLGVVGDYNQILGNTFAGHDTAGIQIYAGATNNHVAWNNLEDEAVAKIVNAGGATNTIVNATAGVFKVGDSPAGAQTTYLAIEPTGDTYWTGAGSGLAFGYIDGIDESVTCTLINVWYPVTFDTAGASNMTTVSIVTEDITILKAGVYTTHVIACVHSAGAQDFEFMVKKNGGTGDLAPHLFQTTGVAAKVENVSGSCLVTVAENDTIELWVRCTDAAGKIAIFDHVSLACSQLGG